MPRAFAAVVVAALAVSPALAQDAPALLATFRTERAEAAKTFPPADLTAADDLAARAEAALKEGNASTAARLARDARWQLPFLPTGLPAHVSRVLGVARLRHADRANALAYSPDGTLLASASRDGTVKVWNLGNGREVTTYRGHADRAAADPAKAKAESTAVLVVPSVAFAPDGSAVASAGGTEIHVWDPRTGKLLHTLRGGHRQAEIKGLAYGPDSNTLVSGGDDRKVIVWDVKAGKPAVTFPDQPQRVEGLTVGGKGKLIATVNAAGELYVYPLGKDGATTPLLSIGGVVDGASQGYGVAFVGDGGGVVTCGGDNQATLTAGPNPDGSNPGTGAKIRRYVGHTDKVFAVAAAPDGKLLVTGGKDATVRVWEVASGKPVRAYLGHQGPVTTVAVRPDGKQVATGGEDGSIRLWPLSATDEHRAATEATDSLWMVAVSPDGKRFAAAGADRTVRVYDAATGKLEKTLPGHKGAIPALTFLGNDAVASGSGDKLVKVWTLSSGAAQDLAGHTSAVLAVTADEAGKLLVSGSVDKTVRAWEPQSGKTLWTWTGKSAVCAVAIRKDGQRVAVGTADGWLTILAPAGSGEPKVVGQVSAHGAGVAGVAFHPDGSRAATCGGDGTVRVWTTPDEGNPAQAGKLEPPTRGGPAPGVSPITGVAYSADGRLIASGGADAVTRVWDAQSGAEVRAFRGHTDWVTSVAFGPTGKAVYSAGVDKAVRSFELAQQDTAVASGHTLPVLCVAVGPDGKYAATGSADKTVRVWDLATGKEVATLTGATDEVNAVAFAGPETVAYVGVDGKLRWWSVKPPRETRAADTGKGFVLAVPGDGGRATLASVLPAGNETQAIFEVIAPGMASTKLTDKGRKVTCAALSADGSVGLAGAEDGSVRLWDLGTKDRLGGDWPLFVKAVADLGLTPDKKTLVAIDEEGLVKVADVAKRAAGEGVVAAPKGVAGIVVAPTGDKFATLSVDGEVIAWDLKVKELRTWKLPAPPAAAVFSADGKKLITGNRDGTAYVLDLP